MSGPAKNPAEEAVEFFEDVSNSSITFSEFSRQFEEFGRSKNIPLKDILNWKEDLYVMARRYESMNGTQAAEHYLLLHFEMFKVKFTEPLPKGSRPVTETGDSDSE